MVSILVNFPIFALVISVSTMIKGFRMFRELDPSIRISNLKGLAAHSPS